MITTTEFYIAISVLVLLAVATILIFVSKKRVKPRSRLANLGFLLVIFGIIFSIEGRVISYSFMGAGILLSVIDIIRDIKYRYT